MMNTTPRLPVDVLSYIVEFVDHPKDLLAFALTARVFCAEIIPKHIDYRCITCDEYSFQHVVKHLLDTPGACARIRYLNVGIEPDQRMVLPRMCDFDSEVDASYGDTFFLQLLSEMVNLRELQFSTEVPNNTNAWAVLEAVGKAGCVEELEVRARKAQNETNALEPPSQHLEEGEFSKGTDQFSLVCLPSLRKYIIRNDPFYDSLQTLHAPNLTHMNVTSRHPPAFLSGYWPNLLHLVCDNNGPNRTPESDIHNLRPFFHRHSNLITLSANGLLPPGWAIESDEFLPNLRSLEIKQYTSAYRDATITSHIAAHLTHLHMDPSLYSYLTKHKIILPNLESCVYVADPRISMQNLVDLIPNIKKLYVIFEVIRIDSFHWRHMTGSEIMERIPLFSEFKYLRALLGVFNQPDICIDDPSLRKLLYNFPNLLYTGAKLSMDGPFEYLRLERDHIAKVVKYRVEKPRPKECDDRSWGGFFYL